MRRLSAMLGITLLLAMLVNPGRLRAAGFNDPNADRDALPSVPAGFEISFFAREPLVRQPCSMAFDAMGRLYVGMGPQYRNPKPDTPGDSVVMVRDTDGDGRADRTKTFASGFNAVQGLAWHGRDLWVANAPDLTIVRDLDGDDEADEYVKVYTDLGNLEHGLHGLNWAPDGKLYMSKGNSKGLTQPGRMAPKPFRELWGVTASAGSEDFPKPQRFTKHTYRRTYHDPEDDWGREGGILRCDDGGHNLEIVARGFRNPWDITFDHGFNWLGTDNDQTSGDRVFMPFYGAHFGWNHPWSAHWPTELHLPTAPVSGPLFEGSGTGVVFGDSPWFPPSHRGVFFVNDWLRKITFVWRPRWDGPLLRSAGGDWEPFVRGGTALFRPTDLEFGPDGALWILGWSSGYGAEYKNGQMTSEGRVFRVVSKASPPAKWRTPKRGKPLAQWTVPELVEDFDGPLPVWRTNAQDELVRRGYRIKGELLALLKNSRPGQARETWIAWTLGRLSLQDQTMDEWFAARVNDSAASLNLRIQALRILAHRVRQGGGREELPTVVLNALQHSEPRMRFEGLQAIAQVRQKSATPALLELLGTENDPTTFYAGWQALRRLQQGASLKQVLTDSRPGVRVAALLALVEDHTLQQPEIQRLERDSDSRVREVAALWLRKASGGGEAMLVRGRPLQNVQSDMTAPSSGISFVRNLQVRSGRVYLLAPGALKAGARPYSDRGYPLKQVPSPLIGADFIQTANEDDASQGNEWLTFETLVPARISVALDTRTTPPAWLREKFELSEHRIQADHWTFQLYSREFPPGRVELGGNTDNGKPGGKGNYMVVLEPLPLQPPANPAAMEATLERLAKGDRERGRWLFHAPGGAGCFNCHHLEARGNNFGPDLAGIGSQATARHIVQSMLEPSAVITEGYNLQTIETAEAEYSGVLLEESGLSVTLGLVNGNREVIPKPKISSRKTSPASAMPAYDAVLNSQYLADIAAYLLAQTAEAKPPTPGSATAVVPEPVVAWPQGDGFRVTESSNRLLISHSGKPVGEFVFRDSQIRRPYFANVHAPGGIKVTRNHPPIPGVDATDHDTMHPGIWLGFGDINRTDFWRNRGRMEHVRFVQAPSSRGDQLTFSTESRLLTADGQKVCSVTNHITVTSQPKAWLIVWDATFHANDMDVTFGDQEEMGFGARVATAITEKGGGMITSSTGRTTAKNTWGQAADWCDYSGVIEGKPAGITLMAHPENFRPSWWHNRDYGVFVANPFGRAAMKQGNISSIALKPGDTLRLRFGAAIHGGVNYVPGKAYEAFARSEQSAANNLIKVSANGKGFIFSESGSSFSPRGFNYDRDASHRLLESYWKTEWQTVVEDFQEMKALGANTVRVHLQLSEFMTSPHEANLENLQQLARLLALAETNDLFLDITGLGCYEKQKAPAWYNELSEKDRWATQARFWELIARTCQGSPAVFCYNLMNEPVITTGKPETDWLAGPPLDKFYYVQRINLDPNGRTQKQIARTWIETLVGGIRKHDKQHLITVGVIPWALTFPKAKPVFYAPDVAGKLDFVSVHVYPKAGELERAFVALADYNIGKPVVIEEIFPLHCSMDELDHFIKQSRNLVTGYIGFYWGKTIQDYTSRQQRSIGEELTLRWLEYFRHNFSPHAPELR